MGIKLLKLLGWELAFADSIKKIREKELKVLRSDAIRVAFNSKSRSLSFHVSFSFILIS